MTTATIQYSGELRTTCTHTKSNTNVVTDAPVDNHGKGETFSPTDLLSSSLVSCMMTLMGITAEAHGIAFTEAKAEMVKVMGVNPRRVEEIQITLTFSESFSDKERELLEAAAINCPVAKSLHPDLKQSVEFVYPA